MADHESTVPPGSDGESEPLRGPDYMNVVDKVVSVDCQGGTSIPSDQMPRARIELPMPIEEMNKIPIEQLAKVVCGEGVEDNTIRPNPNFKPFWPEDLPLPKRRPPKSPPPPEPS